MVRNYLTMLHQDTERARCVYILEGEIYSMCVCVSITDMMINTNKRIRDLSV